jgi:hypothetical protein
MIYVCLHSLQKVHPMNASGEVEYVGMLQCKQNVERDAVLMCVVLFSFQVCLLSSRYHQIIAAAHTTSLL